jgi:hypothetical protein
MISHNLDYDINAMGLVGLSGLLIKLLLNESPSIDGLSGPARASVWGYSVTAGAVLTTMFITFALVSKMSPIADKNSMSFIASLFSHSLPSILLLGVLIWLITINTIYYKRINKDEVSEEFYSYTGVSTFLVIIQSVVLFKYINDELKFSSESDTFEKVIEKSLSSKLSSITYVITMGNCILAAIMTIILAFFSTDG